MKFNAHESFYIRRGWISKGLKNVIKNPGVFMTKEPRANDVLGIGTNMVKSLRYWLQATGLTTEEKKEQKLTKLGEIIWKEDRYVEELGTLCLLHYKLATNKDKATSWYYFFNEFNLSAFNKSDFVSLVSNYAKINNKEVAQGSYEKDCTCLINTYSKQKKRLNPEDNIRSPLEELGLVAVHDRAKNIFIKKSPNGIPLIVLFAVIVDNAKEKKEIKISSLISENGNIGKVFNINSVNILPCLYKLQDRGFLSVVKTAGMDVVRIKTDFDFFDLVRLYYKELEVCF
ncbi:MAG: DUF4007 family protein [Alkaliphilus sp.]